MFLSKIWFILIALVCAIAATFALIAPRPLRIASVKDANGASLELAAVQREYAPAAQRYRRVKRPDALEIGGDAR